MNIIFLFLNFGGISWKSGSSRSGISVEKVKDISLPSLCFTPQHPFLSGRQQNASQDPWQQKSKGLQHQARSYPSKE